MNQNKPKLKLEIDSNQYSSQKNLTKKQYNNYIKTNPLTNYQIKKPKNYSKKNIIKKEYVISVENILNKVRENVQLKHSKISSKKKLTEISTNKNISKEKTMNNTFNTNNTYSNINSNNNIYQNSNSNNTYINEEINGNINEDEISKNEENKSNIKNSNKDSKKIKVKTLTNFNMNNLGLLNPENNKLHFHREYYSITDKVEEMKKLKQKLFLSSNKFYYHNKERGILNKIKQLKNRDIEQELKQMGYDFTGNKKMNYYCDLKRPPTKICFGKGVSSMKADDEDKEIYEKTFLKNLKNKSNENQINANHFHELMTKGFCGSRKNVNKYDVIYENKLITNSNSTKKYKKKNQIITGQNLYPLLKEKKILRNILPKEFDYNTKITLNDVINEELHPLYRYQKKNINFHSGLLSHEINFLFVKTFALGQMVDKKKEMMNKKMDEQFNILSKTLIEQYSNKGPAEKILTETEKKAISRRKYLLQKFEFAIKKSFYQFRRMKIDIGEFLKITRYDIPIQDTEGLYLFKAIKDGDLENIERIIKSNYNYALFKDEFGQTAMHIAAKRNIYQIIQLLISRLGDIDAQDIYGRTPLMCATEYMHLETICVLLCYYADPNIEDKQGKKAIDYIKDEKKENEVIEYKIKRALKFVRLIHLFNRMMVNEKDFDTFIKNSLNYLFKHELDIEYQEYLKENENVLKDDEEKKYK